MTVIKLTIDQMREVLYYETGFEQLHPIPPIINWMRSLGYRYTHDWRCYRREQTIEWVLEFPSADVAELFVLKWL